MVSYRDDIALVLVGWEGASLEERREGKTSMERLLRSPCLSGRPATTTTIKERASVKF
jgi:hypothetical protein